MKTNDTKSILLVGVGGQGTILASKILSEGLVRKGYDVKMSEIHGMSQPLADGCNHTCPFRQQSLLANCSCRRG